MTTQPTTLRLTDALADYTGCTLAQMDQATAELRRLAKVEAQRDALLEALKRVVGFWDTLAFDGSAINNLHAEARAAIRAVEGENT